MAYSSSGLSMLSSANGFTLWHYTSTDTVATINTAAYFTGDAVNMLNARDLIIVNSSSGGTAVMSLNQVLTNDGTTVDVADGTVLSATDSD